MHLYLDQFLESHDFPVFNNTPKFLVIASTPRCGSHMLGHTLYKTNAFGFPLEYLNPVNIPNWKERFGTKDTLDMLQKIWNYRTSPNGVFGIKLHYDHIGQLGDFSKVKEVFPNAFYILLNRKDVLMQAVSYAVALQTGVWINGQKTKQKEPKYSYKLIDKCLHKVIIDNASWRYILATSGCQYVELDFDSIIHDTPSVILKIAKLMNVNIDISNIPNHPTTIKQRSILKQEWGRRFVEEHDSAPFFKSKIILTSFIKYQLKYLFNIKTKKSKAK